MTQTLNLLVAGLQRQRPRLCLRNAGLAAVALAAAAVVAGAGMNWAAQDQSAQAIGAERSLAALQARAPAASVTAAAQAAERSRIELAALQAQDAGQQQVRRAIESGAAGRSQGYSAYLLALARHSRGGLWITGVQLGEDGSALDLQGRMTDARELPQYLALLNEEPLFRGRTFSQLSVRSAAAVAAAAANGTLSVAPTEAGALAGGVIEFSLRAQVRAESAAGTPGQTP
jgi:hypothetical protein